MRFTVAALLFVFCAAGCGEAPVEENYKTPNANQVTMRLLGVRAPGPVLLQVASVAVVVDGQAVSVALEPGAVDLGTADHAWPVATVEIPEGAQQVAMTLEFHPEGSLERAGVPEPLDLRGAPISWMSPATLLLERRKVVLEVDIERSLAERDGQAAFFLPSFVVRY
ncbi:MAG: hypothetical protein M3Y59_18780 [Myxococcota bacterium]|nr:hypothetical protein [Myxococcota bacterium]